MGSGSDFTAFQDFAGIPSVDMGFGYGKDSPVYHYHSNYDSFYWMEKYGDPGFHYHTTIAKVWGLVAANLIETPVIQFSTNDYATALNKYVDSVKDKVSESNFYTAHNSSLFAGLDAALARFSIAAKAHDVVGGALMQKLNNNDIPWWKWWERVRLFYDIRQVNTKTKLLERQFLYAKGLDERPWFKHVVFAPGKWTGYAGATFPGIVEAVEEGKWEDARRWVGIAEGVVSKAAEWLE
jgi:N-acetylated-alpha-linked acidic dipeptidase